MNPKKLPKTFSTNCLLCQCDLQKSNNHSSEYENSLLYTSWNESCATSLCQVLNLKNEPYRNVFLDAKYCSRCLQIIRNIDFTLKTVERLQQNLHIFRDSVERLLKDNYEDIKSEVDADQAVEAHEYMSTAWITSYSGSVRKIYETISCQDLKGSMFKLKRDSIDRTGFESINDEDELKSVESPRPRPTRKCNVTVTTTCYEADPEEGPPFVKAEPMEELTKDESISSMNAKARKFNRSLKKNTAHEDDNNVGKRRARRKTRNNRNPDGVDSLEAREPKLIPSPLQYPLDENVDLDFVNELDENDSESGSTISSENSGDKYKKSKNVLSRGNNNQKRPAKNPTSTATQRCTFNETCKFSARSQIQLKAHVNKVHKGEDQPFHCEICKVEAKKYKFGSTTSYYYHQKKCHSNSESNITCDTCKKSFVARWELRKHMNLIHAEYTSKLKCVYCKKMFDEKKVDELAKHESLHGSKEKPFACVLCDMEGFTNSFDLSVHVRQEHEDILEKCETCNKTFNTKKKLTRHIATSHTARNPALQCPQCPFIALCKSALYRHIDWHSNQRNFQCDRCPNRYKTQSCLNYHINVTHGQDKAFRCKLCDKSFGSTCTLKAHEESHNTEKTYCCDLCGKAFMAKKNLEQHIRGHNGTLKKYKKAAGPALLRKLKLETSGSVSTATVAHTDHPKQDETPNPSVIPLRSSIPKSNDQVASGSVPSPSSSWNIGAANPHLPVSHSANFAILQIQSPHHPLPGLDLSQGTNYMTAQQQHHSTFSGDRYSYT